MKNFIKTLITVLVVSLIGATENQPVLNEEQQDELMS